MRHDSSDDRVNIRIKRRLRTMPIALMGVGVLLLILASMIGLSYETSTRFHSIEKGWENYS
jgi:hypothetical protein